MRRIALMIALLIATMVAFAAEKTTEVFTLDHQMSQHCEKKIKENLRFEKGISKIEVSLDDNTITITYDPAKTDTEKIIAGFKKIGFNAERICPSQSHSSLKEDGVKKRCANCPSAGGGSCHGD